MHSATIALGSNLASWAGPPRDTLAAAALRLASLGRIACRSSLYSTAPVGFAEQPRFVNAVVALETDLRPRALLEGLLNIEQEFCRDRTSGFANGPRTLDLDLLLFDDLRINEPGLEIPHPRMAERQFVLVPLCELNNLMGDRASAESVSQWLQSVQSRDGSDADGVVAIQSDGWRAGACLRDE